MLSTIIQIKGNYEGYFNNEAGCVMGEVKKIYSFFIITRKWYLQIPKK